MITLDDRFTTAALPRPIASPWPGRVMSAFLITSLLIPAAPVNKLLFVAMFVWTLHLLLDPRAGLRLRLAPMIVLAIFSFGLLLSFVNDVNRALSFQFFSAGFVLFLIHFVRGYGIDLDRLSTTACIWLVLFTALFLLATFLPDLPFASALKDLLETYSLSSSGEREFGDSPTISLHLGTVPFLFVGFCLVAKRLADRFRWRDLLLLLAISATIVLSASRGLVAVCLAFGLYMMLSRGSLGRRLATLAGLSLLTSAIAAYLLSETLLLSSEETSNAVKLGHIQSYFDDLTWWSALVGRGLASYYFSSGALARLAHTEVTPLDFARYVGVPLTLTLYATIVLPSCRLSAYGGSNRAWVVAMLLYVGLSATNPVLFNSYGMLVVLWYWHHILAGERRP